MFFPGRGGARLARFRQTVEPPHVPADADPVREVSLRPAPKVQGAHRLGDLEHPEGVPDVGPHETRAARQVRPQPVLGFSRRRRDHDVAHQRGHPAVEHQASIARLKEPVHVRQLDLDPEDFLQPHRAHPDEPVSLPDRVLGVDEGRAAFERGSDERPDLPLACHRLRRR